MGGQPKSLESNSTREAASNSRGRKRTESWDDKKTASKNYRGLVYVDKIEFLDSRSNGNGESMPDESPEEHNTSSADGPF